MSPLIMKYDSQLECNLENSSKHFLKQKTLTFSTATISPIAIN